MTLNADYQAELHDIIHIQSKDLSTTLISEPAAVEECYQYLSASEYPFFFLSLDTGYPASIHAFMPPSRLTALTYPISFRLLVANGDLLLNIQITTIFAFLSGMISFI